MEETTSADAPPATVSSLQETMEREVRRLRDEARERAGAARLLRPLATPALLGSPQRLGKALAKLREKLPAEAGARMGIGDVLARLQGYVDEAPLLLRREMSREVKAAAAARGIDLQVISREAPVELRLAPLSVILDFDRGRAILQFARDPFATCPPTVEDVFKTHERVLKRLNASFDPAQFFERCHRAYRLALAARSLPEGERVEMIDYLPVLALQMQSRRFAESPTAANFRPYARAQFAYDVLRLREAGALAQKGWRINFGVATGTSASEKGRAIYLEDRSGIGEYKLTVFFTRAAESGA